MMSVSDPDAVRAGRWLSRPGCRAVMAALGGVEGDTRFVGGAVRDALLDRPVNDIDLATRLVPDEVVRRAQEAGLKAVPTGIDHGTVTIVAEHTPYEVTSLRKDVETDGRRAVVAFTQDWSEDAMRRDFTINALYADRDGRIYDAVGGMTDLANRTLRFIGDAETRIREDYLRILRFFRFASQIEYLVLDRAGLMACAALAPGLADLSVERVQAELFKLLGGADPVDALRQMAAAGILQQVLPEARSMARLEAVARVERDRLFEADPERRFYALLGARHVGPVGQRLRLSNRALARLKAISDAEDVQRAHKLVAPAMEVAALQRALHRLGAGAFRDLVVLLWADDSGDHRENLWRALLAHADVWQPRTLPVSGDDITALGIEPGPRVGQILSLLDDWWSQNGFPDREAVLGRLYELV